MRPFLPYILIIALMTLFTGVSAQSQELALHSERSINPKSISIYPNPATDHIDINLGQLSAQKVKVTLYNIIGNEIEVEKEIIDDRKIRINVKEFSAGYYLVALRDEETNLRGTYKFLKR